MGIHIIKNPNGTYSFVGSVPLELAFDPIPTAEQAALIKQCGPGFCREVKTHVFSSSAEAREFAEAAGYTIQQDADYDT